MIRDYDEKDMNSVLEALCEYNYDHPEGFFYPIKINLGLSYDKLPGEAKAIMKSLIKQSLHSSDIVDSRLTTEDNEYFWKKSDETTPTDELVFESKNDCIKISSFWMPPDYSKKGTPADLIISKTIPLPDVILNFKEFAIEGSSNSFTLSFRVFLYTDWKERVDRIKSQEDSLTVIGGIIPHYKPSTKKKNKKQKDFQVAFPICLGTNTDFLIVFNMAYKGCSRSELREFDIADIHMWNTLILNAFYGVQLALLNPITERVIARSRQNPISERKVTIGKKIKDRKTIYIKKYYLREKEINKAIEDYRMHNIKCPLWWVLGHYRKYKNGKIIWISGYWKGKDRDKFTSLNENENEKLRQRLIDMRSVE